MGRLYARADRGACRWRPERCLGAVSRRTNLTLCRLAPLFGVSKSAADRIIDHLGPMLALQGRKRFTKDTVLIVDGTLVEGPRSFRTGTQ